MMNKLLIVILSLLAVSLEAATITNWGAQLPTAVPGSGDAILMQKDGITYYFTPNQLATQLSTNPALVSVTIGNLNGLGTNTTFAGAIGTATNLWQLLGTNGLPLVFVTSNQVMTVSNTLILTARPQSTTTVPLTLIGSQGQDANLLNVKDYLGNVLFAITYDGTFDSPRLAPSSMPGALWTATDDIGHGDWSTNLTPQNLSISNVIASKALILNANKQVTNAATSSDALDNFFAMGITNLKASTGIALATNGGVLWITNTVTTNFYDSSNVKFWGAVGDYVPSTGVGTDDTAAIQAALNFASNAPSRSVYFPSGNYKITDALIIPDQHHMSIRGNEDTVIFQTVAGKDGFKQSGVGTPHAIYGLRISDLRIACAYEPTEIVGGIGLHLIDVNNGVFFAVKIESDHGIDGFTNGVVLNRTFSEGGYWNAFYSVEVRTVRNVNSVAFRTYSGINATFLYAGQLRAEDGILARIDGTQFCAFGTGFESDCAKGVYFGTPSIDQFSYISGCRFEGETVAHIDANLNSYITVVGCAITQGLPSTSFFTNAGDFCDYMPKDGDDTGPIGGYNIREISRGNVSLLSGSYQVKGETDDKRWGFITRRVSGTTPAWSMAADGVHFQDSSGTEKMSVTHDGTVTGTIQAGVLSLGTNVITAGTLAIGTNTASAQLQVVANNVATNVFKFGTTNRPALMLMDTNGTVTHSGHVIFAPDGTYNIGAAGANRPANVFISAGLAVPSVGTDSILFAGTTSIVGGGNGILRFVTSGDFNRFQFGGITAAFPGLGRTNGSLAVMGANGLFGGGNTNHLWIMGGGIIQDFSFVAPAAPDRQGAVYWNDGTNVCVVLRNSAGGLATNKLSMTAWP